MYGTKEASLYDGDIIIEHEGVTYIGRLKPGYPRGATDLPVEDMPVWQIEQIATEEVVVESEEETEIAETSQSEEVTGDVTDDTSSDDEDPEVIYITRRKFPNGNEDYKFVINDYLSYTYEYRH